MASHERFLLLCFIIISIIERNYSWYVQNNHVQQMRREVFQVFARRWGSKAAPTSKSSVDVIMNDGINAHTVRLLLPNTEPGKSDQMIGIFPLEEAMAKALELDTDLVLINDKADPPICKLINSGKFKYLVEKKKKDSSKKQIKSETKELKLSLSIDDHDFEVRIKAARKFIEEGDSVRVVSRLRGRENLNKESGRELQLRFLKTLEDIVVSDCKPLIDGNTVSMLMAPKKKK